MVIALSSICPLWVEPYSSQFLENIICSETCSHPILHLLMEEFSPGASSLLALPMSNYYMDFSGPVISTWYLCAERGITGMGDEGVAAVCRLALNSEEKRVCQEWTSKELWMSEEWQNCAKDVFVERILSVLCILLLYLSAWIEVSLLNCQLLHDSSMFLQPVQSGICLSIWWQECSLFWSL